MQCRICHTEMRIKSNKPVLKKGQFYNRMTLECRNPNCSEHGKEAYIDDKIEVEEVSE